MILKYIRQVTLKSVGTQKSLSIMYNTGELISSSETSAFIAHESDNHLMADDNHLDQNFLPNGHCYFVCLCYRAKQLC